MAYRWLYVASLALALAAACGDESSPGVFMGTGGTGGSAGDGTGGAGGVVLPPPECETSPICRACPSDALCGVDTDCSAGYSCVQSGCTDLDGAAIRQCVFAGGSACNDDSDCSDDRRCVEVEGEGNRCVKTSPGCSQTSDCIVGFECEDSACVDRRVPCILDEDCPKNHTCFGGQANATFCLRIQVDCDTEIDCVDRAPFCVDIDGDGSTECAGSIELNPASGPCTNFTCASEDLGAPVCEAGGVSSVSPCGTYGLCRGPQDCVDGFVCAALWPDGRRECVPEGGSCSSFADCDANQICAAPRDGGPPACQVGTVDGGE
jgi:hypothetical protein